MPTDLPRRRTSLTNDQIVAMTIVVTVVLCLLLAFLSIGTSTMDVPRVVDAAQFDRDLASVMSDRHGQMSMELSMMRQLDYDTLLPHEKTAEREDMLLYAIAWGRLGGHSLDYVDAFATVDAISDPAFRVWAQREIARTGWLEYYNSYPQRVEWGDPFRAEIEVRMPLEEAWPDSIDLIERITPAWRQAYVAHELGLERNVVTAFAAAAFEENVSNWDDLLVGIRRDLGFTFPVQAEELIGYYINKQQFGAAIAFAQEYGLAHRVPAIEQQAYMDGIRRGEYSLVRKPNGSMLRVVPVE